MKNRKLKEVVNIFLLNENLSVEASPKFSKIIFIRKFFLASISLLLVLMNDSSIKSQDFSGSSSSVYDRGVFAGRTVSAVSPPAAYPGQENYDAHGFLMNFPLISLNGRGINTQLNLTYNSNLYNRPTDAQVEEVSGRHSIDPAYGFNLGFGKLIRYNSRRACGYFLAGGVGTCFQRPPTSPLLSSTSYMDSTGAIHGAEGGVANNPSGIKIGSLGVTYPDGTKIIFSSQYGYDYYTHSEVGDTVPGTGSAYCRERCDYFARVIYPVKVIDRNGNFITISYVTFGTSNIPKISTIVDTLGRQLTFVYDGNGELTKITMPGLGGSGEYVVARFYYTTITQIFSFNPQIYPNISRRVLSQLIIPGNNTGWDFSYSSYGMIYRVQKLNGVLLNGDGSIGSLGNIIASTEYNYPLTPSNLTDVPRYTIRTDKWLKNPSVSNTEYEIRNYTFSSEITGSSGNYQKIQYIQSPDGTTIQIHKRYYPAAQATYRWDNKVILEEKVIKNNRIYAHKVLNWERTTNNSSRLTSEIYTNDNGQQATTAYTYQPDPVFDNNLGWRGIFDNIREIKIYDFDGALLRRTEFTYETNSVWTDRWLLKLIKSVKIYKAGQSVPASLTEYFYDSTNLAACPGIVMNDSSIPLQRGNLTSIISYSDATDPTTAITFRKEYDVAGNVVKTIDGKGFVATLSYSDNFGSPNGEARSNLAPPELNNQFTYAYGTSATNALGHTAYSQFDYQTGNVVDAEDNNGIVSTFFYNDPLYRPTQTILANNNPTLRQQTTTIYDDIGIKVTTTADFLSFNDNVLKTEQFVDGIGRVIEARYYKSAGYISTLTEYDIFGRVVRGSNPHRPLLNEQPVWTETKYDALNRIEEIKTSDDAKVLTTYNGNATIVTDQAGKQTRSITNALGQLKRVDEPNEQGQLDVNGVPAQSTSYIYDTLDNLTTVSQDAQTRTFVYDSLSRLKQTTNPESGLMSYQYDDNGNLIQKTDARQVVTNYTYDSLNRVLTRNYTAPSNLPNYQATPNVNYYYDGIYYDAQNIQQTATGSVKGQLTSVSSGISKTNYTAFDALGRVTQNQQITDGVAYNPMTYTYNLSGALIEEKYPSGRVVRNILDNDGDLAMVQSKKNQNAGFFNYAKNFTYTSAGAVSSMQLGNGRWESTQFNSRLQPTQIALGTVQNGTDKLKLNFIYSATPTSTDNNGNVLSQTITVPTVGSNPGFAAVQTYTYDSLNRLKDVKENIDGNPTPAWKQTFLYDRYGNRNFDEANTTTIEKLCGTTVCAAERKVFNPEILPASNRLKADQDADGTSDYLYDEAGNTTRAVTKTPNGNIELRKFTYDAENKQTKVETINSGGTVTGLLGEYFYDGDGKRVKKKAYSGGVLTEETIFVYDAGGKLVAEYANQSSQTPQVSYLTTDHLGSPRITTDANGQVLSRRDFMPFGEELTSAQTAQRNINLHYGQDTVRQKFTSYERDIESELDFAQNRYYNASHGRFTTVDPLMASATVFDPQSFNRFVYVNNNPLNFVDPLGLAGCDPKTDPNCKNETPDVGTFTVEIKIDENYALDISIGGQSIVPKNKDGKSFFGWLYRGAKDLLGFDRGGLPIPTIPKPDPSPDAPTSGGPDSASGGSSSGSNAAYLAWLTWLVIKQQLEEDKANARINTVRRFMSRDEYRTAERTGIIFDPNFGPNGIPATTPNYTARNQSEARRKTGAASAEYYVDFYVRGLRRGPTTNTKGGLPEYRIKGNLTPDRIRGSGRVPNR